jgi:hypothetical protein
VKRSIEGIAKGKGVPSDDFFTKLLTKWSNIISS